MSPNSSCNQNVCPCSSPCPLQKATGVLGGKWKMSILCSLTVDGATRYNELKRRMGGISNTMLAKSLKELEEDGLISRTVYPVVPPRVDYSLTALGESLFPILEAMYRWGSALMQDEGLTPACTMTDSHAMAASSTASAPNAVLQNTPSAACCESDNVLSRRSTTKKEQESCPSCSCHARLKS